MKNNIGLLGLGTHSTNFYIEQLNQAFNKMHGGFSTCPFYMLNIDFDDINPFLPNEQRILVPVLDYYLNEIKELGADIVLIPNITLHHSFDLLPEEQKEKYNVVHPYKLGIDSLKEVGAKQVLLIASAFNMQSDYVREIFEEEGIEIVVPSENEIEEIDKLRKLAYENDLEQKNLQVFQEIVRKYEVNFPVLIACTELSIAAQKIETNNVLDLALLQIEETINLSKRVLT